jgi:hypothetical protein
MENAMPSIFMLCITSCVLPTGYLASNRLSDLMARVTGVWAHREAEWGGVCALVAVAVSG